MTAATTVIVWLTAANVTLFCLAWVLVAGWRLSNLARPSEQ